MYPIWYFITFWIGRYLVDVHGWGLAKIGIYAMIPFIAADAGNILGGLFTQLIIKKGMAVHKARKLAVTVFGLLTAASLILGPHLSLLFPLYRIPQNGFPIPKNPIVSMLFPAKLSL